MPDPIVSDGDVSKANGKVLYITATLPALTVTFIYREIEALTRLGIEILTCSMNRPDASSVSEEAKPLLDTTCYLDRVGLPIKLWSFLRMFLTHPVRLTGSLSIALSPFGKPFPMGYVRIGYHLIEACYLYFRYRDAGIRHIHCHFIRGPTSIGMFLAKLMGTPFSFTMHASSIFVAPIAIKAKLKECAFCVSISEYNRRFVADHYGPDYFDKIHIIHCGVDTGSVRSGRERGTPESSAVDILSVGQLQERKGFHVLIPACAELKRRGIDFRCRIVGGGPREASLRALIRDLDVGDVVEMLGPVPQEELWPYYEAADIFALPCVIAEDGGRDGIPVALMEAMWMRIPVVSTELVGLAELIDSDRNGLLVASDDVLALADALEELANAPDYRLRLGLAAAEKIASDFSIDGSAARLSELFLEASGRSSAST